MTQARIVGWSHLPFGKFDNLDLESLLGQATVAALQHAGIDAQQVDAVFVGHGGMGMVRENFISSYPMQAAPGLRFKPATRVEDACATGTAALYQGIAAIESGQARTVSMHVLACMQLTGTAGDIQVPGATLAGVFTMGGSAVVNCVSILERAK